MNLCRQPLRGLKALRHVNSVFALRSQCRGVFILHSISHPEKAKVLNEALKQFKPEVHIIGDKKDWEAEERYRESQGLELWNDKPRELLGYFTLQEVLRNYIRPGVMLAPFDQIVERPNTVPKIEEQSAFEPLSTDADVDATEADFPLPLPKKQKSQKKEKWKIMERKGVAGLPKYLLADVKDNMYREVTPPRNTKGRGGAIVFLRTAMNTARFVELVQGAHKAIECGLKVEFHVLATQPDGSRVALNKAFKRTLLEPDISQQDSVMVTLDKKKSFRLSRFTWWNENTMGYLRSGAKPRDMYHLQPDILLAAMPEGTDYVIESRSDWREYAFAVGPPDETGTVTNFTEEFDTIVSNLAQYNQKAMAHRETVTRERESRDIQEAEQDAEMADLRMRKMEEEARKEEEAEEIRLAMKADLQAQKLAHYEEKKAAAQLQRQQAMEARKKREKRIRVLNKPLTIKSDQLSDPSAPSTPRIREYRFGVEPTKRNHSRRQREIPIRRTPMVNPAESKFMKLHVSLDASRLGKPTSIPTLKGETNAYRPLMGDTTIDSDALPASTQVGYRSLRNALASRISPRPFRNGKANAKQWWT